MHYRVEYSPELNRRYPTATKPARKKPIKAIVLAIVTATLIYVSVHTGLLKQLLPGDPAVTSAAVSDLVEQVGEGVPVSDAFFAFCKSIITGEIR